MTVILECMKPTTLTIRAIGAEFGRRTLYPVAVVSLVIAIVLLGVTIWLMTLNAWWGLLLFALVSTLCVAVAIFTVFFLIIRSVAPTQNVAQKAAVKVFVSKLQLLADTAATPKFILLFRIIKDVAAPRADGYIGTLTTATKAIKSDYVELIRLFR